MPADALRHPPEILWARRLAWLYFFLLIFEGALRKWALPSLANPLILARDPVVILIYLLAASRRSFPINSFIGCSIALSFLLGFTAMAFGHGNLWVTLYGLRTNFLHLPLIFILPQLFSLDDVWRFGKALLWLSLPMSVLIMLQFIAAPSSALNIAVGGTSSQLIGAMGHVRPSGTFSFATGVTSFLSLQFAFIIAAFMDRRLPVLRSLALLALILALACSISRAAVFACASLVAALAWGMTLNPTRTKRALGFVGVLLLLAALLSFTPVFQYGQQVLSARFQDAQLATRAESLGLFQRVINDILDPFRALPFVTLTGAGTGAGTNIGAQFLVGSRSFLLAELEWSRLFLESGLILGLFLVGMRITLSFYILWWAFRSLKKSDNWVPWLIGFSIFPWVFNGPWGQPTMLGFACFGAGLALAATRPTFQEHPLFNLARGSIKRS